MTVGMTSSKTGAIDVDLILFDYLILCTISFGSWHIGNNMHIIIMNT